MFLKRTSRRKNGKEHHYWSLVENKRVSGGRVGVFGGQRGDGIVLCIDAGALQTLRSIWERLRHGGLAGVGRGSSQPRLGRTLAKEFDTVLLCTRGCEGPEQFLRNVWHLG